VRARLAAMRALVRKITLALTVVCGCAAVVGCGDDTGGGPDGGGGAGGSGGGTGGSGGAMDAGDGKSGTVGCLSPEDVPVACPSPPVTYAQVQPIIQARCVSICHNGVTLDTTPGVPPGTTIWALTDRDHILKDWADTVRDTMANCAMPPPDANVPVTIEERRAIIELIRCEGPK
jgi:hypothetical protein